MQKRVAQGVAGRDHTLSAFSVKLLRDRAGAPYLRVSGGLHPPYLPNDLHKAPSQRPFETLFEGSLRKFLRKSRRSALPSLSLRSARARLVPPRHRAASGRAWVLTSLAVLPPSRGHQALFFAACGATHPAKPHFATWIPSQIIFTYKNANSAVQ